MIVKIPKRNWVNQSAKQSDPKPQPKAPRPIKVVKRAVENCYEVTRGTK